MFSLSPKAEKDPRPSLTARQKELALTQQTFCSASATSWLDEPTHLRKGNLLTQSTESNITFHPETPSQTQRE